MTKIFISYSHEDRPRVNPFADGLRHLGYDVFFVDSQMPATENFAEILNKAIRDSDVVIPVVTLKSLVSNWLTTELGIALTMQEKGGSKVVIPLIVDDLRIPAQLAEYKAVKANLSAPGETCKQLSLLIEYSIKLKQSSQEKLTLKEKKKESNQRLQYYAIGSAAFGLLTLLFRSFDFEMTIATMLFALGFSAFPVLYLKSTTDSNANDESLLAEGMIESNQDLVDGSTESITSSRDWRSKALRKLNFQQKQTVSRLSIAQAAATKRATASLVTGIIIAGIGISLLFGLLILNSNTFQTMELFLQHFLPRLTFIISIEVLAMYFLRLYKENLASEREIRNEITDLECRYVGVKSGILAETKIENTSLYGAILPSRGFGFVNHEKSDIGFSGDGIKMTFENKLGTDCAEGKSK